MIIKLTDIRHILLQTTASIYLALMENCKCQDFGSQPTTRHTHHSLKWALFTYSQLIMLPELFQTSH